MTNSVPFRRVGGSGLVVSAVGLGCNNFGRPGTRTETLEGTRAVLDAAIEGGVTFLDTADIYGSGFGVSETLMGEALRGRRDEVVLATKFGHAQLAPATTGGGNGSRPAHHSPAGGTRPRRKPAGTRPHQANPPDPDAP